MSVGARPMIELLASGSSRFVSRDMPEPSAWSPERLGPPCSHAPRSADFLSEGGLARPERFATAIHGLVRAIDSPLGGRGQLARSFQANPGHLIRPAHESLKKRMMARSVEKLAHTGVFFTVTSLPMVMNVHAEAGNPL